MTGLNVSPLAPDGFPALGPIAGVTMATAEAGIRGAGRSDVLLMLLDRGTTAAGVFTQSRCSSAPVEWCRKALANGSARALLVNSGNANAFTGKRGREAVRESVRMVARIAQCRQSEVFVASTGVIGEPLDPRKFAAVMEDLSGQATPSGWEASATAIMTTDTYPKGATRQVLVGSEMVTINGIAKGAGMIAPDMATMLSFVVTDAAIAAPVLQRLLARSIRPSFNAITVDSDTSTSDTVLMFATGAIAGAPITDVRDSRLRGFREALDAVVMDLAHQVVRDGEGARHFVEIHVRGAVSRRSARTIAMSIANSPLVKTAIAGEDANWGRVVMAVGKAGEPADRDRLAIWFGDVRVAVRGERDPKYSEAETMAVMKRDKIAITVDVGVGNGSAIVWTCDLTKDYVAINGDYRT